MLISSIDHIVITVKNIELTCSFYKSVLDLEIVSFEDGRQAIKVGDQKINLHEVGKERSPRAFNPMPGSADLCFISTCTIQAFVDHLVKNSIHIELGPVKRYGVFGEMDSVYFRDPDQNLIEVSQYRNT